MEIKINKIIAGTMVAFSSTKLLLPALANDSFSLQQLLSSTQESSQSQNLINQISSNLHDSKIKLDQVQCTGTKSHKPDGSILGARSAPFDCRFPNKITLRINANNFVILPSGRATPLENAREF
ncbi:hypothetical protein NIES4071_06420 [Calothrix sp. NIES-4071]|nr:hypothetical protein NIES4071_06420 [Calothrix sp. NIES-4071]BAZ54985.1 hypothetical protein NIES4105_06390 [Calothrix sp. NIES-4105]